MPISLTPRALGFQHSVYQTLKSTHESPYLLLIFGKHWLHLIRLDIATDQLPSHDQCLESIPCAEPVDLICENLSNRCSASM